MQAIADNELKLMPELQENERMIVSTRVFAAPRRMVMHGPDGTNYPNEMMFTAVVPMERVELDLVGGREGAVPVHLHKTITWTDEDGGTRLTMTNEFPSRELRDENVRTYGSVKGGRDLFERLAAVLATKGERA